MNNNIYYRIFIYSRTQQDNLIKIEKDRGNAPPVFGKVIVRGVPKTYTEIVQSKSAMRYPDSRILIDGDIRTIKYTESSIGR